DAVGSTYRTAAGFRCQEPFESKKNSRAACTEVWVVVRAEFNETSARERGKLAKLPSTRQVRKRAIVEVDYTVLTEHRKNGIVPAAQVASARDQHVVVFDCEVSDGTLRGRGVLVVRV